MKDLQVRIISILSDGRARNYKEIEEELGGSTNVYEIIKRINKKAGAEIIKKTGSRPVEFQLKTAEEYEKERKGDQV